MRIVGKADGLLHGDKGRLVRSLSPDLERKATHDKLF